MKHLNAILSGNYISPSLQAELGRIIPSLLPLCNKALIEHQLTTLPKGSLLINIPQTLSDQQKFLLSKLAEPDYYTYTSEKIDLPVSILQIIKFAEKQNYETIALVMGDTIIENYRWSINSLSYHEIITNYDWAMAQDETRAFSGYLYLKVKDAMLHFEDPVNINRGIPQSLLENADRNDSGQWYDFGHYHNYHNSKKSFMSHRYFNSLTATEYSLIKTSEMIPKIQAEVMWYRMVPKDISYHCPKIFASNKNSYEIEHIYGNTLAELLLFSNLPDTVWTNIESKIMNLLDKFSNYSCAKRKNENLRSFVTRKTKKRLLEYPNSNFEADKVFLIDNQSPVTINLITKFIDDVWNENDNGQYTIVHGDLCFSNILYEARSQQLKLIDPRGLNEAGEQSIYGYLEYDIAKLVHSFQYGYDFVVADRIITNYDADTQILTSNYTQAFRPRSAFLLEKICNRYGISTTLVKLITLNLFLSMIPLHSDHVSRQYTFFYIAARIYLDLKEELS